MKRCTTPIFNPKTYRSPADLIHDYWPPPEADRILKALEHRIGDLDIWHLIGTGSSGAAYYAQGDVVLKVTDDIGELAAANLIMNRPHPNFAKVYESFLICLEGGSRYREDGGIGITVKEFVPVVPTQKGPEVVQTAKTLDDIWVEMRKNRDRTPSGWDAVRTEKELMVEGISNLRKAAVVTKDPFFHEVADGYEHLYKNKAYSNDYHAGNIGISKDGHALIFDYSAPTRGLRERSFEALPDDFEVVYA